MTEARANIMNGATAGATSQTGEGSQGLDGMSTWDTGTGGLTDSSRWGSRRGGTEEQGGEEVSNVEE